MVLKISIFNYGFGKDLDNMDEVVFGEKDSKFLNEDLDVDYDADEEMTEESEEFKFGRNFETAPEGDPIFNIIFNTFDMLETSKINITTMYYV